MTSLTVKPPQGPTTWLLSLSISLSEIVHCTLLVQLFQFAIFIGSINGIKYHFVEYETDI